MRNYLAVVLALICMVQQTTWAGESSYKGSADLPAKSAWMAWLSDQARVRDITVPGTHDSGARYGGIHVKTQSLTITQQLNAGVRYLDVRLRHTGNSFAVHHGAFYQEAMFGDVLGEVVRFLANNPSEFVFMRVKEEYKPANNTRSFERTFDSYRARYSSYIWSPTSDTNPRISDVRGRIVFLQDFASGALPAVGLSYNSFDIQDEWEVGYDFGKENFKKFGYITGYLAAAQNSSSNIINQLPISSPPQTPYGSAEAINDLVYEYLMLDTYGPDGLDLPRYLGIVTMDFPGSDLVNVLVRANNLGCKKAYLDPREGRIVGCMGDVFKSNLRSSSAMSTSCSGKRVWSGFKSYCYVKNAVGYAPIIIGLGDQCSVLKATQGRYLGCSSESSATHTEPVISCNGSFDVSNGQCTEVRSGKPKKLDLTCYGNRFYVPEESIKSLACSKPSESSASKTSASSGTSGGNLTVSGSVSASASASVESEGSPTIRAAVGVPVSATSR